MPHLSHNTWRDGDVWRRDSEVLKWLATQEDLQMWLFSILRCSGLVIYDKAQEKYVGDPNWSGRNKREESRKLNTNRGGRTVVHRLDGILGKIADDESVSAKKWFERCSGDMSRASFYRNMRRAKENGLVKWISPGGYQIVKPSTPSTSLSSPTTTACCPVAPLS